MNYSYSTQGSGGIGDVIRTGAKGLLRGAFNTIKNAQVPKALEETTTRLQKGLVQSNTPIYTETPVYTETPTPLKPTSSTSVGLIGGAPTPAEQAVMDKNASLMKQYGQGNYTIDAKGNVLPKTTQQPVKQQGQQQGQQDIQRETTPPATPDYFEQNVKKLTGLGNLASDPEVKEAMERVRQSQGSMNKLQFMGMGGSGVKQAQAGAQGYAQAIQSSMLSAEQANLANVLEAKGMERSAAESAASLASPVGQFGMLTNPITGEPLNTQVFQSAIQQAQQLVNSGTPAESASVQALLEPFGFVGPLAFNQAMQTQSEGNWNPSAQSAGASTTIQSGAGAQQQAFTLDTGIKQLNAIEPVINSVMQSSGINSTDSPLYNARIGTYISQLGNPGAWAQFQFAMGEMRKFQSQLLASGAGGIPTDVSDTINATDISQLSLKDIRTAMQTLDSLGKMQQAVLQAQQKATGVQGYSGQQQSINQPIPVATPSTSPGGGVTSPAGQFGAGAGLEIAGGLVGDLSKMIMSFIAGRVTK